MHGVNRLQIVIIKIFKTHQDKQGTPVQNSKFASKTKMFKNKCALNKN